jgi:hypothetical protein
VSDRVERDPSDLVGAKRRTTREDAPVDLPGRVDEAGPGGEQQQEGGQAASHGARELTAKTACSSAIFGSQRRRALSLQAQ